MASPKTICDKCFEHFVATERRGSNSLTMRAQIVSHTTVGQLLRGALAMALGVLGAVPVDHSHK